MEIELNPKAERQWKHLRKQSLLFSRIEQALDELAENPYLGKSLEGEFIGLRSIRVGDWRVIYKIVEHRQVVVVISIANRKEAYR